MSGSRGGITGAGGGSGQPGAPGSGAGGAWAPGPPHSGFAPAAPAAPGPALPPASPPGPVSGKGACPKHGESVPPIETEPRLPQLPWGTETPGPARGGSVTAPIRGEVSRSSLRWGVPRSEIPLQTEMAVSPNLPPFRTGVAFQSQTPFHLTGRGVALARGCGTELPRQMRGAGVPSGWGP